VPVEIIFETHSTSTDNEAGVATGWNDGRLSPTGRSQAAELGERRRKDVDVVFSSDLARAIETVEIAFRESGIPIHLDPRLRECNYGAWNGLPVERIIAERHARIKDPFPGGESYEDVVTRTTDFLTEVGRHWCDRRILVVGHRATRWSLDHLLNEESLSHLVDAPFDWREGWVYELPHNWKPGFST
jgi:broad specificity phosphatase PhoE